MHIITAPRLLASTAAAVAVLAVAGCGGTSYGSTPLTGSGSGQAALGSGTPTPSATPPPAQATDTPTQAVVTTAPVKTPPPPTARPTQQAAAFAIGINGDNTSKPQFDPPAARVYTGTVITFTNHDAVARSVVSDNGAFDSGPIAPGASWKYTAATAGTFNYHDGTRPYAVAYFQVTAP